jgi:hypothetical protein
MTFTLPEKSKCKPSDAPAVEKYLKSIIAYQPGARTTYQFYEVIDAWLGPWGENGYPIGYGRKYNIAFTTDAYLNAPKRPISATWVRQTTVNLQLPLIDLIVARIKAGTIATLDEKTLRAAAFAAHPKAYRDGGLMYVANYEVESIHRIILIPYAEYNPLDVPNLIATITQILGVIKDPGLIVWLTALSNGVAKWQVSVIRDLLGDTFTYLDWQIKELYGYPGKLY